MQLDQVVEEVLELEAALLLLAVRTLIQVKVKLQLLMLR